MIPYIVHVAILLAGCLAFYKLLLQRETFFRLNRWVLVGCIALAFVLPLARVPQQWSLRSSSDLVVPAPLAPGANQELANTGEEEYRSSTDISVTATQPLPATQQAVSAREKEPAKPFFNAANLLRWTFWLYWFGVLAFGINLLVQAGLLLYRALRSPVIRDGRFRIIELSGKVAPCSFGPFIFINPEQYDWDTYNQVLEHEKIHCREGHTWDILLAEIVLVFQWFNPFAWSFRKTLENNLEFLTDAQLLDRTQVDPASYQMSLLRVSAPHLPLGLTTNYNQSLLKKRVLMMHSKRSNIHTAWKYFFLLPVLALFMCLLNEPAAQAQQQSRNERKHRTPDTEGYWFATIKGDRIQFNFQDDEKENSRSMNGNSFALADFPNLPRGNSGQFSLKRDAGTMEFTGKFDGDQGMGRYKFVADPSYVTFLKNEGIDPGADGDRMVLFFVNAGKDYISSLKKLGYTDISRNDLIPMAALHIDAAYVQSLRDAGFTNISLRDLIPFKSLGIDKAYIQDVRKAYPRVTASQLISFKAQGIDGKYIDAVRTSAGKARIASEAEADKAATPDDSNRDDAAVNVNTNVNTRVRARESGDRVRHPRDSSDDDDDASDEIHLLVSMKALGVDEAYIKSIRGAGFPDLSLRKIIGFKSLGITAAYINELRASFPDLQANDVSGAKAMDINAAFVKSFEKSGFQQLRLRDIISLKATGVTPELVQQYRDLGFATARVQDIIGAKSVGVTPEYIRSMRAKGYLEKDLKKLMGQKATVD